jgi:thiamine-phosphate pyrophosphorylase
MRGTYRGAASLLKGMRFFISRENSRREEIREMREYGLYVVTCGDESSGRGHLDVAEAALVGGSRALQLRDKEMPARGLLVLALRIREMIDRHAPGTLFIVNDRVDVAAVAGADGVHLGQEDLPCRAARELLGPDAVIGISATTFAEALEAEADGADYLGVGPIFPTPSKRDAAPAMGLAELAKIRAAVRVPIVAIGGISEENAQAVLRAGADSVAVISALTGAPDMVEAARRLSRMMA